MYVVHGRAKPVLSGPNSTDPNLFHHGEHTYRVVWLSEDLTLTDEILGVWQPTSGNILCSSNKEWITLHLKVFHWCLVAFLSALSPSCHIKLEGSTITPLLSLVKHNFLAQHGNWEDVHRTHPAHHNVYLRDFWFNTTLHWGRFEIIWRSRHQDPDPTALFVEQSISFSTPPPLMNRRLVRRLFIHRPLDVSPYHLNLRKQRYSRPTK